MAEIKYLYHYTAGILWGKIKESGYIKLTPSNLLKPKNMHWEVVNGIRTLADETDDYKPVVWLTTNESPNDNGNLEKVGKNEIQIVIPYDEKKHIWWVEWKDKNRMNKSWFKKLTSHGERYGTWYVCEEIIPVEDIACVKNLKTGEIIYGKIDGNE